MNMELLAAWAMLGIMAAFIIMVIILIARDWK